MDFCALAIKKATKLGVDEAEVYFLKKNITKVEFASTIESFKTVASLGLGVRVAQGKKIGLHATSILTEAEVTKAVEKAVKIAKVTPEDPNWHEFNKNFGKTSVKGNYDKTLGNLDYDSIIDKVIGGINKASENERKVKVTRGSLTLNKGEISVANSYNDTMTYNGTYITT
ncbi:MAG: PmbA/TldA family metallopeptidase, partial [Promethearchaeota archaeon]